ncbi:MAG: hypothetical protein LBQ43_00985 [Holosporales bacterium]|nr:hypothetical protein [Holosporales bacterium]
MLHNGDTPADVAARFTLVDAYEALQKLEGKIHERTRTCSVVYTWYRR